MCEEWIQRPGLVATSKSKMCEEGEIKEEFPLTLVLETSFVN